jgi:hypothetical protein
MIFLKDSSWVVRQTKEKGNGLFTTETIPPGKVIGDYTGTVIHPMDADRYEKGEHFYLMYYHDYASIFPDLSQPDVYLLNHSCTPNCWIYTYKGHTLFFTLRKIFPGEELTISYLLSPQSMFCEPCTHLCRCESDFCTKSMHLSGNQYNAWQKASRHIAQKTKRERIQRGKELPLLTTYPESIPDHSIYTLFGNVKKNAKQIQASSLPEIQLLRRLIRETGQVLSFPKLTMTVLGIAEDTVITNQTSSIHLQ